MHLFLNMFGRDTRRQIACSNVEKKAPIMLVHIEEKDINIPLETYTSGIIFWSFHVSDGQATLVGSALLPK